MDRETTEVKVGKNTFVVKTYATARETNAIQKVYFDGAKVEIVGDAPKISDFNPSVQFEVQLEMIKQMVVSMSNTTENIVERCENLPDAEFQDLATHIDEIIAKKNT